MFSRLSPPPCTSSTSSASSARGSHRAGLLDPRAKRKACESEPASGLPGLGSAVYDDDSFSSVDEPESPPARPSRRPGQTSGRDLQDRVQAELRAHPRAEGYTVDELHGMLRPRQPQLTRKQVSYACNALVRGSLARLSGPSRSVYRRLTLIESDSPRPFVCSRQHLPLLLGLFAERFTSYRELSEAVRMPAMAVTQFSKMLRASGASADLSGMALVRAHHPGVLAALWQIHQMVVPQTSRTPLPPRPETLQQGHRTFVDFLASQPPDEWFDLQTDLLRRFDCEGSEAWARSCLDRDMDKGWLERDSAQGLRYRLRPGYRQAFIDMAASERWRTLFPDTALPGDRRPLPDLAGHLRSRGISLGAPSSVGLVQDLLASRGWPAAVACPAFPLVSSAALLHWLQNQARSQAVLCMPGTPAYLEAWRDRHGVWLARSLLGPLPPRQAQWTGCDVDREEDTGADAPARPHTLPALVERQLGLLAGAGAVADIGVVMLD